MSAAEAGLLALYYLVLSAVAVYSVHRFHLVRLRRRSPQPARATAQLFPPLTVQLPLYNEPRVAARLLEAVMRLEYPGALDIQVLDDSTDETSRIVADAAARDPRIAHIRRPARDGFKAGALAHGMRSSDAQLFAIFDADFVPPPDVLLRIVPHFAANARVGMVQARWTHLNRDESLLTRVQALFLDAHFAVESAARNFGGRFFNFNGTAGVWRRAAIEDAGGWSSSTLTEDLDLSYRAQLAGWDFVFLNDVEVPAELPAALSGFQDQQHRWVKGSIQTARKLVGRIVKSELPRATKLEALLHLTNNAAYLLSVVLALLMVPAMLVRYEHDLTWTFAIDLLLFVTSSGSVLLFYREGQRWAGRPAPPLRDLLAVLPVGVGMAVRNAGAVVEGVFETGGYFKRTPKAGSPSLFDRSGGATRVAANRDAFRSRWSSGVAEALLALFFLGTIVTFAVSGYWTAVPFLTLFVSGYASFAIVNIRDSMG
ncbi:MAG TPA: glycosyltransferase [Thermoanaerobaculia bacterium]|jgi:cellulose synthase/poly-beta-1,6-N-acetylglucosamine synthase-like glycosyltransferase